jgi:hypothetical protein
MGFRVDVNRRGFERLRHGISLLEITEGDMQGPVLTRAAQVHRKQEREIFATEGAAGGGGTWAGLSPAYAARKRAAMLAGRKERKEAKTLVGKIKSLVQGAKDRPISMKVLIWSGDMRDRFLTPGRPEYVERYISTSPGRGSFQFGAASTIASYHKAGGAHLPVRDMVTKSRAQVIEILDSVVKWYRNERVPQAMRAIGAGGSRLLGPTGGGTSIRAASPNP